MWVGDRVSAHNGIYNSGGGGLVAVGWWRGQLLIPVFFFRPPRAALPALCGEDVGLRRLNWSA